MPAITPNTPEPSCIVAIIHPTNAPLTTRADSPMACVREGVFGSTSTTYSPTAAAVMTILQIPFRTSNTAATGVKVRSPETNPMLRARTRAVTPLVLPGCACRSDKHPLWVSGRNPTVLPCPVTATNGHRRDDYNQLHIRPHHQFWHRINPHDHKTGH